MVALNRAHARGIHILGAMADAMTGTRQALGEHAPRIEIISNPVLRAWP
jgi:polyribonucleotide nucleotidyltransferase